MNIKPIKDHKGYMICDAGIVFCNLGKGNRNKDHTVPAYEIKPRTTTHGYDRIYARNNITGRREDLYIHRLVAQHFIPNPEGKKYVNHLNCCRNDNRVENLEWATAKENTDYTMQVGHISRDKDGKYVSKVA